MNQAPEFAPTDEPPAAFTQVPEPPRADAVDGTQRAIHQTVLTITLVVLGLAVLVFLVAVNQIITVWLQHQWVPIARAGLALAVVMLCAWVLMRLTRREPA